MSYTTYANKTRSQKLVLAHIEANQRLSVFTLDTGTIYKKSVNYFVIGVKENGTSLSEASSNSVVTGEFYYDAINGELYVNTTDDSDPKTKTIVVTYRLFYSNMSIDLPYDLNTGLEVHYDGRIMSNSPINKDLDYEQTGIVLESETTINLENQDAHFDDFFDLLVFENRPIQLYSWNETIALSDKQKIFDGIIQNKKFSEKSIGFKCKDSVYQLRKPISSENFTNSDGTIPEQYLFKPKRKIYGELKQLQCTPVDAILDGFTLTGTISGNAGTTSITGTGTSFLSECAKEDEIIVETANENYTYTIASIQSDTALTLASNLDINLTNETVKNKPKRGYRGKNRNWHIAGHKLRQPTTTVDVGTQPNRFTVASTVDLFSGNLIKVAGESVFIKRISDSEIILETNLQGGTPSNGDSVVRSPVSKVFYNGVELIVDRDYTISNEASDAILQIDALAEFNVAPAISVPVDLTFTNGSNEITTTLVDFRTEFQVRDWVRSDDITHTAWYEIIEVKENKLIVSVNYAGGTTTTNAEKKNVNLIQDDSILTVNTLGLERSSAWVKTASDAVKDILENDAVVTNINTASFIEADADAPFILSYKIPEQIGGSVKSCKDVISDINGSVFGSLVTDKDFNFKYQILTAERPSDLSVLKDDDILGITSIQTKNEIVRKVNAQYQPFTDKFLGGDAFSLYEFENDFVDDLVGVSSELDIVLYLYNLDDATTIAQRYALYNSLSQSTFTIKGKLNLILKELNDKLFLNLDRLYKRFGNLGRYKIGIINKVSNDGANVSLEINDLGNAFNRVSVVSDNATNDYTSADNKEIAVSSFVVDTETLTPDTTNDDNIYNNLIG